VTITGLLGAAESTLGTFDASPERSTVVILINSGLVRNPANGSVVLDERGNPTLDYTRLEAMAYHIVTSEVGGGEITGTFSMNNDNPIRVNVGPSLNTAAGQTLQATEIDLIPTMDLTSGEILNVEIKALRFDDYSASRAIEFGSHPIA
jgi:hypothetical protein